ncbi:MAG: GMP/IMP nucleotidase [Agitococcus sp.]|nr:GMP/IMP nucleotidase [Agitococcus sp.]
MINWSSIDTVLLDMDGTLLDLHFDNYFWQVFVPQKYGQQHGLNLEESKTALYPRFHAQAGSLNWYCLDHWSDDLKLDIVALKHELQHLIRPRADAMLFLQALAQSDKHVWMVTNAHPDALKLKLSVTGIAPYFHHIMSSHQFGKPKEHIEFWQALQHHLHFNPKRSLFIDDSEAVLATANSFGIGHILSIQQPDSQLAARSGLSFPAIHHFIDILPID